eukprot:scaffold16716_cov134-Isochrysis_galbana.AAC.8
MGLSGEWAVCGIAPVSGVRRIAHRVTTSPKCLNPTSHSSVERRASIASDERGRTDEPTRTSRVPPSSSGSVRCCLDVYAMCELSSVVCCAALARACTVYSLGVCRVSRVAVR